MQVPTAYGAELTALDRRIEVFRRTQLFPLAEVERHMALQMYTIHCLAHASTIQLHAVFSQQNEVSRAKCLDAATEILRADVAAQVQNTVSYIEPALGVCLQFCLSASPTNDSTAYLGSCWSSRNNRNCRLTIALRANW
jgi:hypothetical protein